MTNDQAFPRAYNDHGGMTLREYYMAHAPITLDDAAQYVRFHQENTRAAYGYSDLMNAMKELREKYADAMLAARDDNK